MKLKWLDEKRQTSTRLQLLFKNKLRELGMKSHELAVRSGASQGNIHHWLYMGRNFTVYTAAVMAAAIGYELHFYLKPTTRAAAPGPTAHKEWFYVI
jgi:hypothetical protein